MIEITWSDPVNGKETKQYSVLDDVFEESMCLGLLAACLPEHGTIVLYNSDEPHEITVERV